MAAQPSKPSPQRKGVSTDERRAILLERAAGATLDQLQTLHPQVARQRLDQLTKDPKAVQDAFGRAKPEARAAAVERVAQAPSPTERAAFEHAVGASRRAQQREAGLRDADAAEGLGDDPASDGLVAITPEGDPSAESLEDKANKLTAEQQAKQDGKQVEVPEGKVAVTVLGKGRGVPASVVHMDRLDYNELRRLRGEGVTAPELTKRFNLPGQLVREVVKDIQPVQEPRDATDARAQVAAEAAKGGSGKGGGGGKHRWTHEQYVEMARDTKLAEDHDGDLSGVEKKWGLKATTLRTTLRWAQREHLLPEAEKEEEPANA